VIALALAVAGAAVYSNSLSGPFIFDDLDTIIDRAEGSGLWSLWNAFAERPQLPLAGRPVASLSFALNYWAGGRDVRGYHAVNLAIHLGCALALFGIVDRTLRREVFLGRFDRAGPWPALIVALIFTVHPLQTESVTYITQRTELLAGVFLLFTLYAAIRAWEDSRPGLWSGAAVVSCALGMASKEVMVAAPLAVLLYDWVFTRHPMGVLLRRRGWLYVGLAATWAILAALLWGAPRSGTIGFGLGVSALDYLRTQAGVILHYFRLVFWPHPLVLSYDWPMAHAWSDCLPQFVIVAALVAATVYGVVRRSWVGFLGAWCFLLLAPTSSFVPIVTEIVAERRMYLPLAAVTSLPVVGGWRCLAVLADRSPARSRLVRTLGAAAAVAVIASLGYGTLRRNADYQDPVRMWSSVIAQYPRHAAAYAYRGRALVAQGRSEEAVGDYRRAVELDPELTYVHPELALVLSRQGRMEEAIEVYRAGLRYHPNNHAMHNELGLALAQSGRAEEALGHFREAVRLKPEYPEAHNNLAILLAGSGRVDEAVRECREAIRLKPDNAGSYVNLGHLLRNQDKGQEAVEAFRQAAKLNPDDAGAQYFWGEALEALGRRGEAEARYREALRLDPGNADARSRLQGGSGGPSRP
jgi:tetratricopeptide (TPR) repeat protein